MASLERYRGHFYNWYDTQTLQPLQPMYVSTVDSGNLAAHLLTLRAGLLALPDQPIFATRVFDGLADTLGVLRESQREEMTPLHAELRRELASAIAAGVTSLDDARRRLERLVTLISEIVPGAVGVAPRSDGRQRGLAGLGSHVTRPVPGRPRRPCIHSAMDVVASTTGWAGGPAVARRDSDAA